MNPIKSNLQLIITHPNSDDVVTVISGCASVIRDIELSIVDFMNKRDSLKITKTNKGFKLSPKAYMAVQHIIYDKIK